MQKRARQGRLLCVERNERRKSLHVDFEGEALIRVMDLSNGIFANEFHI